MLTKALALVGDLIYEYFSRYDDTIRFEEMVELCISIILR